MDTEHIIAEHEAGDETRAEIRIPDGVTHIPSRFFEGYASLRQVYLPKSVRCLGDSLFVGCSPLTVLYDGTRREFIALGESSFEVIREYQSGKWDRYPYYNSDGSGYVERRVMLYFHAGGENIMVRFSDGDYMLYNPVFRPDENGLLTFPASGRAVWGSMLRDEDRVVTAVVREGVETVGDFCFQDCKSLREVRLPASLKRLGRGAFHHCPSLERVILAGGEPMEIGDSLFSGSSLCVEITYGGEMAALEGMLAFRLGKGLSHTLLSPIGSDEGDRRVFHIQTLADGKQKTVVGLPASIFVKE